MAWYTIFEVKTPTDSKVVFDGKCSKDDALSAMSRLHEITGSRVIVTKGKSLGKFVAEIGA